MIKSTPYMKKNNMVLKSANFRKHIKICLWFLTLLTILNLTVCACTLFFHFNEPKDIKPDEIFTNSLYSIVEVKAYSESVGESFGTAEFIDNSGNLITNAHVVTYTKLNQISVFDNFYIRFATDEEYIRVSLIKFDENLDIAVLNMDPRIHKFSPLEIADSSKIETGDKVYALGNMNNHGISFTSGYISIAHINISYNNTTRLVIKCDLTISDGNSGGALLDEEGKLIGITSFRLKDKNNNVIYGISYCIPINTVMEYI